MKKNNEQELMKGEGEGHISINKSITGTAGEIMYLLWQLGRCNREGDELREHYERVGLFLFNFGIPFESSLHAYAEDGGLLLGWLLAFILRLFCLLFL
jgi:hypothetical protein